LGDYVPLARVYTVIVHVSQGSSHVKRIKIVVIMLLMMMMMMMMMMMLLLLLLLMVLLL